MLYILAKHSIEFFNLESISRTVISTQTVQPVISADRHGLKLYFVLSYIMIGMSKIRTPEQISKKMINEERTIIDLELAIKKEQFRNDYKKTSEFDEAYVKVTDQMPHELDISLECWCTDQPQ